MKQGLQLAAGILMAASLVVPPADVGSQNAQAQQQTSSVQAAQPRRFSFLVVAGSLGHSQEADGTTVGPQFAGPPSAIHLSFPLATLAIAEISQSQNTVRTPTPADLLSDKTKLAATFCGAGHQQVDRISGGGAPAPENWGHLTGDELITDKANIATVVFMGQVAAVDYGWKSYANRGGEIYADAHFKTITILKDTSSPARAGSPIEIFASGGAAVDSAQHCHLDVSVGSEIRVGNVYIVFASVQADGTLWASEWREWYLVNDSTSAGMMRNSGTEAPITNLQRILSDIRAANGTL